MILADMTARGFEHVPGALIWTVIVIVYLITLIAMAGKWKVYRKAGEAGWKSLIPFYCSYIDYRISWDAKMFWAYFICSLTGSLIIGTSTYLALAAVILLVISFCISFVQDYKMAAAFGYGIGFALGLIFFRPLFTIILGFGRSRYRGPA